MSSGDLEKYAIKKLIAKLAAGEDGQNQAAVEDVYLFLDEMNVIYTVSRALRADGYMEKHNVLNTYDPFVMVIYHLDRLFAHPLGKIHKTTFQGCLGISNPEDARRKSKVEYRKHYELVRRITPKDRLLEFKLSDGWEMLCEFLGKPVPGKPFPHFNVKKWLDEKARPSIARG
ncbi:uncharacterized protein BDW43DRAFT_306607 [Aspergillus alliaceus]|uniref:uncharacterized protein n=1 Tax=Petromyces alliaceus TaxID=209559 RepID=UPI0012A70C3A|nr:uncharacterized protein BDW43DRAFT_306607 [Aspergillus alliaceus]KAB8237907.1 hypothetical protein BDW43DRAFT_306607 [Aspergillus alliaceus]